MSSDELARLSAQVGALTQRVDLMVDSAAKDHDLLTRIDANLTIFMKLFADHERKDEQTFGEHRRILQSQQRIVFMGMGMVVAVDVLLRLWLK